MSSKAPFQPHLYAICPPGFEAVCADELRALGARRVSTEPGGLRFAGNDEVMLRANLWLRSASRVLKVLAGGKTARFEQLIHRVERVPWDSYLLPQQPVKVHVSCSKSRLYHSGAVAQRVEALLGERKGEGPAQGIWVRIIHDHMTISIDSTGELLHKRSYRHRSVRAPIRENIAAGLLLAAQWDPDTPLIDPMCGSGTFLIEAAWIAQGRAPGLDRKFACERWPVTNEALSGRLRKKAKEAVEADLPTIIGCDWDGNAIEAAQANVARAGLKLQLEQYDARELPRPDGPPGLLICNPPYGRRMRGGTAVPETFAKLRARFKDWKVAYLTSRRARVPEGFQELLQCNNGGLTLRALLSR